MALTSRSQRTTLITFSPCEIYNIMSYCDSIQSAKPKRITKFVQCDCLYLDLGDRWTLTIVDTEDEGYFLEFGLIGLPQYVAARYYYVIGGSTNVRSSNDHLSYENYFRNDSGTHVFFTIKLNLHFKPEFTSGF